MTTTELVPLGGDLQVAPDPAKVERTATHMAREYREATEAIARHLAGILDQTRRLAEAFPADHSPFDVSLNYDGDHCLRLDEPGKLFQKMSRRAWAVLVDHLGVKQVMSVKKRHEFEEQLKRGDLPEISEQTITGIVLGLAQQARDFAREAAVEVLGILRPSHLHFGGQYKTNNAFRVGRKVILCWYVERCWNARSFRVHYNREAEVTAIDGVFHVLDGKGVMREHKGPLCRAIEASPDGKGETKYFRFRCFKNRNLHLEMKRLDLVRELNLLATGEAVLGHDMTE
jgi:hypothetical protein